jgi:hypothetical protein
MDGYAASSGRRGHGCVVVGGFFEPLVPLPGEPEENRRTPPWFGAPRGMLPGVVALECVLARTDRAAVCVTRMGAYPSGFEIDLMTLSPTASDDLDPLLFGPPRRRGATHEGLAPEMLRFGVQFADGDKATNVGGYPADPDVAPAGAVIVPGGGGGGGGRWHQSLWVWPLPPPGPLLLVCEWPAAGIPLTRREIDARLIIDAATRAQVVFSDEALPEPPAGAGPPPVPHSG